MVDACHIVPIGRHGSDHVTNGLSLCPNLHRAFDRGLLSVTTATACWSPTPSAKRKATRTV
jgi:predicted restriction endonuclease